MDNNETTNVAVASSISARMIFGLVASSLSIVGIFIPMMNISIREREMPLLLSTNPIVYMPIVVCALAGGYTAWNRKYAIFWITGLFMTILWLFFVLPSFSDTMAAPFKEGILKGMNTSISPSDIFIEQGNGVLIFGTVALMMIATAIGRLWPKAK